MLRLFNIVLDYVTSFFNTSWKYFQKSYSQEGEDLVLSSCLKERKKGFYVDVGACHPFRFSNTYLFYKKGWNGINIDANPGSMNLFNKFRQRDINLEVSISNRNKKINFYVFDESALNSFSSELSKRRMIKTNYKIKKIIKLKPEKLSEILDKYLPVNTKINFMSIDVEGYEYQVLLSNNWNKYKPEYLVIEFLDTCLENILKTNIYSFIKKKNYFIIGYTGRSVIFKINENNCN